MALVLPPNEVFQVPPAPLVNTQGGYGTWGWIKDVCPESGGLFSHYQSEPYPRKGHTYPEAIEANNIFKKLTIGSLVSLAVPQAILPGIGFLLLPWKFKVKWLEKILFNYSRMGEYIQRNHYMKRRFYNVFAKELWSTVYVFLKQIGISAPVAYSCGRIVAHILEHEDAYRARLQDIFTEASQEALIKTPRQEIKRLTEIYISREKEGLEERILALPKILLALMWIPRIKKIFVETMKQVKFQDLQYDEADRYYVLNRSGYEYLGLPVEERFKEYQKTHNEFVFRKLTEIITEPEALERVKQQLITLGLT